MIRSKAGEALGLAWQRGLGHPWSIEGLNRRHPSRRSSNVAQGSLM